MRRLRLRKLAILFRLGGFVPVFLGVYVVARLDGVEHARERRGHDHELDCASLLAGLKDGVRSCQSQSESLHPSTSEITAESRVRVHSTIDGGRDELLVRVGYSRVDPER